MLKGLTLELTVDFSGVTLLPSSKEGYWVELSILKNKALIRLQEKLLEKLKAFKILSGVEDKFRPHVTFAKTKSGKINVEHLEYSFTRKRNVPAKIILGKATSMFNISKS